MAEYGHSMVTESTCLMTIIKDFFIQFIPATNLDKEYPFCHISHDRNSNFGKSNYEYGYSMATGSTYLITVIKVECLTV
jgi:hypothetical protein